MRRRSEYKPMTIRWKEPAMKRKKTNEKHETECIEHINITELLCSFHSGIKCAYLHCDEIYVEFFFGKVTTYSFPIHK